MLSPFGGCARAIMDDVYAIGPARVVFPAVQRFAVLLKKGTGLTINASKSACYSRAYALEDCPYRYDAGIPIGAVTAPNGAVHVLNAGGSVVTHYPLADKCYCTAH